MIVSISSLGVGLIVGYLGQRSRMCTIGGLRDWVLVRDTALLKGVAAMLVASWVVFGVIRQISRLERGSRAARRRDDADRAARGRRDPDRRPAARLLHDALGRLPAAPARARRAGPRSAPGPSWAASTSPRSSTRAGSPHTSAGGCCEGRVPRQRRDVVAEAAGRARGDHRLLRSTRAATRAGRATAARSPRRVPSASPASAWPTCSAPRRPDDLVFTKNATEALNLAILGLAAGVTRARDDLARAQLGDAAAARARAARAAARSTSCRADGNTGEIDLDEWAARARRARRRLAIATHASNVTGVLLPIGDLAALRRRAEPPLRRRCLPERRAHPARRRRRSAPRPSRCPATRGCSGRPAPACFISRPASTSSR